MTDTSKRKIHCKNCLNYIRDDTADWLEEYHMRTNPDQEIPEWVKNMKKCKFDDRFVQGGQPFTRNERFWDCELYEVRLDAD